MIAAVISSIGMAVPFLQRAEENRYTPDLCSFHRLAAGMAFADYLPRPDCVLSLSVLCDGSNRFFANMARLFNVPHWLLEVPNVHRGESLEFLENQLHRARMSLEAELGRRSSSSDWESVFAYEKEMLAELEGIRRLQERVPCPVPGDQALGIVGMIYAAAGNPFGPQLFRNWRLNLASEIPSSEKYRLFWLHLRPYFPSDFFPMLAQRDTSIVGDELSSFPRANLDFRKPERSLAEKIYQNPAVGEIFHRIEHSIREARRLGAQGVVHFSHRGYRQSSGGAFLVKEGLKRAGLPCLILEGDCIDPREYSSEQMRTRIEGFLEML